MTKLQEFRALLARTLEDELGDAPALALFKLLQEVEEEDHSSFQRAKQSSQFVMLFEAIEEGLTLNVRPASEFGDDDIMLGCGMDDDEPSTEDVNERLMHDYSNLRPIPTHEANVADVIASMDFAQIEARALAHEQLSYVDLYNPDEVMG